MKKFGKMEHGGDIISYQKLYDGKIIDFSSNINPLGLPEGLQNRLNQSFSTLVKYPDIKYRLLKQSISKYLKCKGENVVVGNGAVEIINNFIHLFDRVVVFVPCFSEYEKRGKILGKQVLNLPLNCEFGVNIDLIKNHIKQGDILVLANPNNPTGLRINKQLLVDIYNIVLEKEAFLLLDEAFFEFCPQDYDSINLFEKNNFKNIAIIRAATKFFALPGIRLGYCCTSLDMAKKYESIELPWSINALADCAGRYIFECNDYIDKTKQYINTERQFLLNQLFNIKGIKVFNTQSNFILIKLLNWDEDFIFYEFLKKGILIRKCSSFKGLDKTYIRVAIKDRFSNLRLVHCFKKLESV